MTFMVSRLRMFDDGAIVCLGACAASDLLSRGLEFRCTGRLVCGDFNIYEKHLWKSVPYYLKCFPY